MRAKKHLGQNFLSSSSILKKMVVASGIKDSDIVLEIGPGRGSLTTELLNCAKKVIAVEKDDELIPKLTAQFEEEIRSGKLELINGDILDLLSDKNPLQTKDYKLKTTNNYKVVANIPYYITGQIIRLLLSGKTQPRSITLVVQKEVAERIVCRDGKESILSLSVKAYGEPSYVQKISARYFTPKPKVDSAIIHIKNISKKNFRSIKEEIFFFDLIKTGFSHKRKFLLKNLKSLFDNEVLEKSFVTCNISPNARAEEISFDKWLCLFNSLKK